MNALSMSRTNQRCLPRATVALVLLVALVIHAHRAWQECTVWPDVIRYIEQGQQLTRDPLGALRQEAYHPLHSLLTRGAYETLTHYVVADDRLAWIAAAKTVGVLASLFVVWAVIRLSRHLGAPWWAASAAGLLWVVGRRTSTYGADGLSDMLFLALLAWSILVGLGTRLRLRPWPWLLAGLLAGASYLTRPEGVSALILLAFALLYHYRRAWRVVLFRPWCWSVLRPGAPRTCILTLLLLALGFAIPAVPYMLAIGNFTRKKIIFETQPAQVCAPDSQPAVTARLLPSNLTDGKAWLKIHRESLETFGWAPCIVVWLAGLIRPRLWGRRHWRPLVLFWIFFWLAIMLWLIDKTRSGDPLQQGYLDGRHTLVLQLVLFPLFALALPLWMRPMVWYQNFWRRLAIWPRLPAVLRSGRWTYVMAGVVFLLAAAPGVHRLFKPMGDDRGYVRQAAAWVAGHASAKAVVYDAQRVVGYYSGRAYAEWLGTPVTPNLPAVPAGVPVILAYIYRDNAPIAPAIGPYRALPVTFKSQSATRGDQMVLYANPDSGALALAPSLNADPHVAIPPQRIDNHP